jgi:hypothetical protein
MTSTAEVKNWRSSTSTPLHAFMERKEKYLFYLYHTQTVPQGFTPVTVWDWPTGLRVFKSLQLTLLIDH